MKIQTLIFFTAMLLFFGTFKAQTNNEWQPVLISSDGTNEFKGVVATYSLATCNSKEIVLVKLVNNNNYALKAQWRNLVQTEDGRDLFGTGEPLLIALAPNSQTSGDCSGNNFQLIIKLSDFSIKSANFKTFIAANFEVTR